MKQRVVLDRGVTSPFPRHGGEVLFQSTADLHGLLQYEAAASTDSVMQQEINANKSVKKDSPLRSNGLRVFMVIISGCLSSVPFELMLRMDRSSALFSAFFLHIYTVLVLFPKAYRDSYVFTSKMPISWHVTFVSLSFLFIWFKSEALENMPMPLFIVCSNMQVVAGVCVGWLVEKKRYSVAQLVSVLCVACGCIIVTLNGHYSSGGKSLMRTLFGLVCIVVAVFILAFLVSASGIVLKKFNADIPEQLFRQHLFALPLFFLQWHRIGPRFEEWADEKRSVIIHDIKIPTLYILLFCTTVFAQLNRQASAVLSVESGPLECQIVTSATKTIVLLISLLYFNAPPYPSVIIWFGVLLQLVGSLAYARLTSLPEVKELSLIPKGSIMSKFSASNTRLDETTDDDEQQAGQAPSGLAGSSSSSSNSGSSGNISSRIQSSKDFSTPTKGVRKSATLESGTGSDLSRSRSNTDIGLMNIT